MNTQTVFASTLLIVLVLLIVFTWTKYPNAKYIVISRTDGEAKFIAIGSLEVIDNRGGRREIIGYEGKSQTIAGFANSTSAKTAAGQAAGDITFDGKKMGYVKDSAVAAGADPVIGPVIAFLPSIGNAGYIIFSLGCSAKIARINLKSAEDDPSRNNMQRVKVVLLDKDKNPIKGAEQIIPVASSSIPQTIHHINFV